MIIETDVGLPYEKVHPKSTDVANNETPACPQARTRRVDFSSVRLTSIVSLSTISRTILLSFQSSFHLLLTVLVRYRSLANI